jgi:hypothetical protein
MTYCSRCGNNLCQCDYNDLVIEFSDVREAVDEIVKLRATIASIADYCAKNIPECDPYCCAEFLQEIADIISGQAKP